MLDILIGILWGLPFIVIALYVIIIIFFTLLRIFYYFGDNIFNNRCLLCDKKILPFFTYCSICNDINKAVHETRRKRHDT